MHKRKKGKRIVIIGTGPCGLGAAWRLHELGYHDFTIYEQNQYVGGLATSFVDPQGFTWDIGGHVIHSHYDYFDRVFEEVMKDEYSTIQRESWIWLYDKFIPYPFQLNIRHLPKAAMQECLRGIELVHREKETPHHFYDWVMSSFGPGIARHFMIPFNRKVWAYPLKQMNYHWVGDRVASVDVERVKDNIRLQRDDVSWGPNHVFKFPNEGGTGEIWKRVADRFPGQIRFGKSVTRIDRRKKIVHFQDGSKEPYDVIFSTMPLDVLVRITSDISFPVHEDKLHAAGVYVIGLGIQGNVPEQLATKCWMYFPERHIPFFRATVFSNYAQTNSPRGTWSLMCEVTTSSYSPVDKMSLVDNVIMGARRAKLISRRSRVVDTFTFFAEYGYPTPTLNRDRYVHAIIPILERYGIYSRGRFGGWKYEVSNQDHTFMQGVEWANAFSGTGDEVTFFSPSEVNARSGRNS